MLRIYFCTPGRNVPAFPEELISGYRKEKLSHQRNERLRRQSLQTERLLRYALHDCGYTVTVALPLITGPHGKPELKDGSLFFSLSHTGDGILCAVSDSPVGADLERRRAHERYEALIRRCFCDAERAYLAASSEPDDTFTELWTKKESYIKLLGHGLSLPLQSFCVLDGSLPVRFYHERRGDNHITVCAEAIAQTPDILEIHDDALMV